ALLQLSGIGDAAEPTVQDPIAAVGDEGLARRRAAQPGARAKALQRRLCSLESEGDDLHRYWSAHAQLFNQLGSVHYDREAPTSGGDDLLVQEGAAQSLDQIERAPLDLVRAVDRQVDLPVLGEGREWNACGPGLGCRAVGRGDAEEA